MDEIITPKSVKVVKNEGMPIFNEDTIEAVIGDPKKGDLILKFNIEFPEKLSDDKKNRLEDILSEYF
jgi:DnaJ-class molecular chaperone